MEKAAYNYLNVVLDKKEALSLYYSLRSYIRERDPLSFGRLMECNDGTLKDYTLMKIVVDLMKSQYPAYLSEAVEAYMAEAISE